MAAPPVLLILGAGPNIGKSLAAAFASAGWRVAQASRGRDDGVAGETAMDLHVDLGVPEAVGDVFAKVREAWAPPSVVVYNAALAKSHDARDPLSAVTLRDHNDAVAVNVTSAVLAAKHAVAGFKDLPPGHHDGKGTFIYTGNRLNVMPLPGLLTFAMCKSASAKMIWDLSVAYAPEGFRFYYADERLQDGSPLYNDLSGEAAATEYFQLARDEKQRSWHYTFVKGKGYVDFHDVDRKAFFP